MADDESPTRNLRVHPDKWRDFGSAVGVRKRSTWLLEFLDAVLLAPQAWREFRAIAEARGDTFATALVKAIRLYRDA